MVKNIIIKNMIVKIMTLFLLSYNQMFPQGLENNEFVYSGSQHYFKPNNKDVVVLGGVKNIYKRNINSRKTKIIYSGTGSQQSVQLSPNRKYIASIQYGVRKEYKPYYRLINNLIVLDTQGNIIHEIDDDVRRYTWSPDGIKIAYITGEYRESKRYKVTGYYVLDIITGEKKPIDGKGGELYWAEFDNQIYFKGWKYISEKHAIPMVYKYDPINNTFEETEYADINFSPGGTYYFKTDDESGEGNRMFVRETSDEITESFVNLPFHKLAMKWEWIADDLLLIKGIISSEEGIAYKTLVYNVTNKTTLIESLGTPIMKYTSNGISRIIMENEIHIITGNEIETIQKTWSD